MFHYKPILDVNIIGKMLYQLFQKITEIYNIDRNSFFDNLIFKKTNLELEKIEILSKNTKKTSLKINTLF